MLVLLLLVFNKTIIQYGSAGYGTNVTVTLPIAFKTQYIPIAVEGNGGATGWGKAAFNIAIIDVTQFRILHFDSCNYFWIAIGI